MLDLGTVKMEAPLSEPRVLTVLHRGKAAMDNNTCLRRSEADEEAATVAMETTIACLCPMGRHDQPLYRRSMERMTTRCLPCQQCPTNLLRRSTTSFCHI